MRGLDDALDQVEVHDYVSGQGGAMDDGANYGLLQGSGIRRMSKALKRNL